MEKTWFFSLDSIIIITEKVGYMKATLLIKDIHKLYATIQGKDAFMCIDHAFVAIHHDTIIDLGNHAYQCWVDKDTRIIDATNEIVVPAFIDTNVTFSFDRRSGDNVRINHETMELFYKNGITGVASKKLPEMASTPFYQLYPCTRKRMPPLIDYEDLQISALPPNFLLTTSFAYDTKPYYDLLPLASLLCIEGKASEWEVLAAMTLRGARVLHLTKKNGIRKGAIADLLIFHASDLHELFHSFGRPRLHRIIHHGVHIYPHVIV
ncbi:amidohydrolase family protein [Merdibacter massiliensis]|uniref:hypothetical protein n=1 Tax=Merdibacter massiliensis TaxID=1871030 RepID=UPI00096A2D18|nr:hypothetical protein [Merdibacter massiliensis]